MRFRFLVAVIALVAMLTPPAAAQSTIELVVSDVDGFWAQQFAYMGLAYASPASSKRPLPAYMEARFSRAEGSSGSIDVACSSSAMASSIRLRVDQMIARTVLASALFGSALSAFLPASEARSISPRARHARASQTWTSGGTSVDRAADARDCSACVHRRRWA